MIIETLLQKEESQDWFNAFFYFIPTDQMELYWEQWKKTTNILTFAANVEGVHKAHIYQHVTQHIINTIGSYKPSAVCDHCVTHESERIKRSLKTQLENFIKSTLNNY